MSSIFEITGKNRRNPWLSKETNEIKFSGFPGYPLIFTGFDGFCQLSRKWRYIPDFFLKLFIFSGFEWLYFSDFPDAEITCGSGYRSIWPCMKPLTWGGPQCGQHSSRAPRDCWAPISPRFSRWWVGVPCFASLEPAGHKILESERPGGRKIAVLAPL